MTLKKILPLAALLAIALPAGTASAAPKSKIKYENAPYSVFEDQGPATITLVRTRGLNREVSVAWRINGGTATAGADYSGPTSGRVTFLAGEDHAKFEIPVTDDSAEEGAEFLNLSLRSPGKGAVAVNPNTTLTILDDDGLPRAALGQASYSAYETDASVAVTINRLGSAAGDLAVHAATSDGTALAGTDYTAVDTDFTWANGDFAAKTVDIGLDDADTVCTGTKTFTLALTTASGTSRLGTPASATISIDDDDCPVSFTLSPAPQTTVAENSADGVDVTIHRNGDRSSAVSVEWTTGGGSASAGIDYSGAPASPDNVETFAAGEYDIVENVAINDDTVLEGDETFTIALQNPVGTSLATPALASPSSHTVTIEDNEQPAPADSGTGGGTAPGGTTPTDTGTTGGEQGGGQIVLGARQAACGLKVTYSKKQKLLKKKVLVLKLRAGQACKVSMTTVIRQLKASKKKGARSAKALRFKGKKASLTLKPGQTKTVKVKFTKKTLKAIKKALKARKKLAATVVVTERDAASKTKRRTLKITLRR